MPYKLYVPGSVGVVPDAEPERACQYCRRIPTRRWRATAKGVRLWECPACATLRDSNYAAAKARVNGATKGA